MIILLLNHSFILQLFCRDPTICPDTMSDSAKKIFLRDIFYALLELKYASMYVKIYNITTNTGFIVRL